MGNKYAEHSKANEKRSEAYRRAHSYGARACSRKRKYDTEAAARKRARKTAPGSLKAYRCPACNFWHLTKAVPLPTSGDME